MQTKNKVPSVYVSDKVIAKLPVIQRIMGIYNEVNCLLETKCSKKQQQILLRMLEKIQDFVDEEKENYLKYSFLLAFEKPEKKEFNIYGDNQDIDFE